jgi:hypothetical protein
MKNRTFIIAILIIVAALSGWYIYVSSQARQMRSVQEVSVDWWGSAHADASAEAFTHWNDDNPPIVPVSCAKCHSTNGFLDYVGQDGSTASVVDEPAAVGSVVSCQVCHNEKSDTLQTVTFPSGTQVDMGTGNALCATCHSGLNSGASVTKAVEGYGDDEVIPNASAVNPHYAIAAATQLGADADSGYQYTGKSYAGRFMHANGVQTCTQCHDPHSLHINQQYGKDANLCSACHSNVTSFADYRDITVDKIDYDGDSKVEGIYFEIQGMREKLYHAMQQYTAKETGKTILWGGNTPTGSLIPITMEKWMTVRLLLITNMSVSRRA